MTGAMAPAEEVVQGAFVQLYRKWSSIEYPTTYVRIAVVNGCRSHGRRQALERRTRMPDREPGVFDTTAIAVRDALQVLTPRRRAAVVWVVPLRGAGQCVYDRVVGPDGDIDHGGDSSCITDLIRTNGFPFLHYPDQLHDRQAASGKVPAGPTQVVFEFDDGEREVPAQAVATDSSARGRPTGCG